MLVSGGGHRIARLDPPLRLNGLQNGRTSFSCFSPLIPLPDQHRGTLRLHQDAIAGSHVLDKTNGIMFNRSTGSCNLLELPLGIPLLQQGQIGFLSIQGGPGGNVLLNRAFVAKYNDGSDRNFVLFYHGFDYSNTGDAHTFVSTPLFDWGVTAAQLACLTGPAGGQKEVHITASDSLASSDEGVNLKYAARLTEFDAGSLAPLPEISLNIRSVKLNEKIFALRQKYGIRDQQPIIVNFRTSPVQWAQAVTAGLSLDWSVIGPVPGAELFYTETPAMRFIQMILVPKGKSY